ncbi:MAG: hypothetical protein ACKO2P_09500, partial [Planctomycetota bacterium]
MLPVSGSKKFLLLCCASMSLAGSCAALLAMIGCQTVPVTERKQLLVMSEERENEMGLAAWQDVMKSEKPSMNEKYNEIVRRVGQRIAA